MEKPRKNLKLIKLGVNNIFRNKQKDSTRFLHKTEKGDAKILRLQMKLRNSPLKRFSLKKPISIKPLVFSHQLTKYSIRSLSKFDIFLNKEAIFRPYPEDKAPEESPINLSFSEKHSYWRNKTLEQYRNCRKNSMRAASLSSSQCSFSTRCPISKSIKSSASSCNSILNSSSQILKIPRYASEKPHKTSKQPKLN